MAAQRSIRRIALDSADGVFVDVTLYDTHTTCEANTVDYLLTAPGEGYVYWSQVTPGGLSRDQWRLVLYLKLNTYTLVLLKLNAS